MKRTVSLIWAGLALASFAGVQFEVKNVEAHQRYPWNGKVDIDFLIDCADSAAEFDVTVECTDHIGGTNVMMKTIKKNDIGETATKFTLQKGQHRLVWNADVDCPNVKLANISFAVFAKLLGEEDAADYLIIDLSGGPEAPAYPVSYRVGIPADGWTDEYKTTKLVMRKCPAGKFINTEYDGGEVTLTKDFFAGVFEVTQKQWFLVMGSLPSSLQDSWNLYGVGDLHPVYYVSYNDVRGKSNGSRWPASSAVDALSFVGKLRAKTGLNELDLPTEAQWECACRAGTTTEYNIGDSEGSLATAGWYSGNEGNKSHPVGQKIENSWGLYDMHGNVSEWCLDWNGENLLGTDPKGAASGSYRRDRGGHWSVRAGYCRSSSRDTSYTGPSGANMHIGFRLFRTCP